MCIVFGLINLVIGIDLLIFGIPNFIAFFAMLVIGVLAILAVSEENPALLTPAMAIIVLCVYMMMVSIFWLFMAIVLFVVVTEKLNDVHSILREIALYFGAVGWRTLFADQSVTLFTAAFFIFLVIGVFMMMNSVLFLWFFRVLQQCRRFLVVSDQISQRHTLCSKSDFVHQCCRSNRNKSGGDSEISLQNAVTAIVDDSCEYLSGVVI